MWLAHIHTEVRHPTEQQDIYCRSGTSWGSHSLHGLTHWMEGVLAPFSHTLHPLWQTLRQTIENSEKCTWNPTSVWIPIGSLNIRVCMKLRLAKILHSSLLFMPMKSNKLQKLCRRHTGLHIMWQVNGYTALAKKWQNWSQSQPLFKEGSSYKKCCNGLMLPASNWIYTLLCYRGAWKSKRYSLCFLRARVTG